MSNEAKVLGIGGVFFKSPDPKGLYGWYRNVLGIEAESWGAQFSFSNCDKNQYSAWSIFDEKTKYFEPGKGQFMINYIINDAEAFELKLNEKGVEIIGKESSEFGKFIWISDPDKNKIELWQPV